MKNIVIEVNRSDIEGRVAMYTSYAGAGAEDGESGGMHYAKLATVSEDSTLLSRFLGDACSRAVERLKAFITDTLYDGEKVRVCVELSSSFDDGVLATVRESFSQYLALFVTSRWMRLAGFAQAAEWDSEGARRLEEMERHMYHRRRPVRRREQKS